MPRRACGGHWAWPRRAGLVALLLTVPGAMFYVAFYSEGMFMLAVALAIWAYQRPSRVLWGALAVVIGCLARSIGPLLAIPLLVTLVTQRRNISFTKVVASLVVAVVGVVSTPLIFLALVGHPLAYEHANAVWTNKFADMSLGDVLHTVRLWLQHPLQPRHLGSSSCPSRVRVPGKPLGGSPRSGRDGCGDVRRRRLGGRRVSQLRYLAVTLPLWVGLYSLVARHRWARVALPVFVAAGFALNIYFPHRFVRGEPMV